MTQPTPNDTLAPAAVWYELAAAEVEIGAASAIVKLPPPTAHTLEPWTIRDTHIGAKNIAGKPRQVLTVCFARQVLAGEPVALPPQRPAARAPQRPAPAAPAQGPATRRLQPRAAVAAPPRGPAPAPVAVSVSDVAAAVETTIVGAVESVVGTVDQVLSSLGVGAPTPAPVSIPAGQACACPEPQPAVESSTAAAVPCRACGGWINNAQPAEQPA